MRFFLPVAIIGLATSAAAADGPNSWDSWVEEWPKCARSCLDTYYDGTLADDCGKDAKSSTDSKDVKCVCTAQADLSDLSDASDLYSCTKKNCADADQDDVKKAGKAAEKLADMCTNISDSSDDDKEGMSHYPFSSQGELRLMT